MKQRIPESKDLLRFEDVPKLLLELSGVRRCRATVYNWATKGRRDYANELIKLKKISRLGTFFTTREWVEEFVRRIG